MIFKDQITIEAPVPKVWDFLMDPECLAAIIPGAENVTPIDERTFDASIAASVGPINGKFQFRAHIEDSNPPTEMVATIDGVDSVTKSPLKARMAVTLQPLGANQTALAYNGSVDVKGRLAILGEMVLRATASLVIEESTRRLRARLAETPASG